MVGMRACVAARVCGASGWVRGADGWLGGWVHKRCDNSLPPPTPRKVVAAN